MDEIWKEIDRNCKTTHAVKEISNTGKVRLFDGTERPSRRREQLWLDGKNVYISRLTIMLFKPDAPKREDQNCVDHITHHPVDILVNDLRNLRWCTRKENNNFDEGRRNKSAAHIGKKLSDETKAKMSAALKGGKCYRFGSDFGRKFYDKYGIYASDDKKLYNKEHLWYLRHNHKCRWE